MEKAVEQVPEWLDETLLRTALRSYRNDDTIEVLNFVISSRFCEHFASTIFQCKIEFKSLKYPKSNLETLSVVIKVKPVNDVLKMEVVSSGPLFETEIQMYKETIPAINELFERSGMKAEFGPELIYAADKPISIIVLKDLTADGFFAPRQPPDELDDSKLIIQRLAQFHAASFYLAAKDLQDFSNYNHSMYHSQDIFNTFFSGIIQAFRDAMETWDGFQQYIPKFDYFLEHIWEIGRKCYTANRPGEGFNVLNHGDFHMRNLLVKNGPENRLESLCFIDYQVSVYCSPAIDLSYMFGVVKMDKNGNVLIDDLIVFYHQEFVKTLKGFGYMEAIPSLLDLNVELLKHGAINVVMGICNIPFAFVDWSTVKAEDIVGKDTEGTKIFRRKLFEHPLCKARLQSEVKSWIHKGWL